MKKRHFSEVPAADVPHPAKDVRVRWLIDESTGAPTFAMRRFEIAPGGNTPLHEHDWEHEVYVLSGTGLLDCDDGEIAFKPGDAVFMPGGERHSFRNTGTEPVVMLCLVPTGTRNRK